MPKIVLLDLVADLETIRKIAGYSREEIAHELDISEGTWAMWLQGTKTPGYKHEPGLIRCLQHIYGQINPGPPKTLRQMLQEFREKSYRWKKMTDGDFALVDLEGNVLELLSDY